jgi:hypothetical protein
MKGTVPVVQYRYGVFVTLNLYPSVQVYRYFL